MVDHEESVSVIVYHASADPWYNINPGEHSARFNYYGVTGIPHAKCDGVIGYHPGTYANSESAYNQRIGIDSPITIDVLAINMETGITATATVTSGDQAVNGNYKIRFALVSNYWDQYTGSNGLGEWWHDLLDMAPSTTGLDFEIEANSTEVFETTFEWPQYLNGQEVDEDNVSVVVFVQNDSGHEVVQSEMTELAAGYFFTATTENTNHLVAPGSEAVFEIDVENLGIYADTYDIALDTDGLPDGWSVSYTTPDGDQNGNSTLTLEPGETYTSIVTVAAGDDSGISGDVNLTFTSQGQNFFTYELPFFAMTSSTMLIVNGDPDGAYADYFTDAVDAAGELNEVPAYGVWPDAMQQLDANELVGSDVELVAWYLGDGGTITTENSSALVEYLNSGGSLFLSGSDAPVAVDGTDLIDMMGADNQGNYDAGYGIWGIAGDPVGDGIDADIMGGDGADNRRTPHSLRLEGSGVQCLMFSNVRRAAVRNEGDNYRTLIFGFPFEAISTAADRNMLMANILNYMQIMGATPELSDEAMPSVYSLQQNYPNPFNPETEITFALPERATVSLSVYDMLGREVARLADGAYSIGVHRVSWSAGNQSSGIYFYQFNAAGENGAFAATRKMLLLK